MVDPTFGSILLNDDLTTEVGKYLRYIDMIMLKRVLKGYRVPSFRQLFMARVGQTTFTGSDIFSQIVESGSIFTGSMILKLLLTSPYLFIGPDWVSNDLDVVTERQNPTPDCPVCRPHAIDVPCRNGEHGGSCGKMGCRCRKREHCNSPLSHLLLSLPLGELMDYEPRTYPFSIIDSSKKWMIGSENVVLNDLTLITGITVRSFIESFDFDFCKVYYDGTTIKAYSLESVSKLRSEYTAINEMKNILYKHGRSPGSRMLERIKERISKYRHRGFEIVLTDSAWEFIRPALGPGHKKETWDVDEQMTRAPRPGIDYSE